MKVQLPSQGILGCSEVELEVPRYKHIREVSQQSYHPDVVGYHLLELLLSDPSDLKRMTFQDKDYLVAIVVASMHLNVMTLKVTCSCGESLSVKYDLSSQELRTLDPDTPTVVIKSTGDRTYEYHVLSAYDEFQLCEWAIAKANQAQGGFEKAYARAYEEGFICRTFGQPLSEKGLEQVASYELVVYYSALLFREMLFHGVYPVVLTTCNKCKRPLNVIVPFSKVLCDWSSSDVVREFVGVSAIVGGFNSFLDLTFSELEQIKSDLSSAEQ